MRRRTPLFSAQQAERYARQQLIKDYEELTGARLIVMIDGVFVTGVTLLEELLADADGGQELHLLLSSPGGDGDVAVRLVRSMQARCSRLSIIVPDMAKSAATIMCLGADQLIMGPASDLGPVDPQFQLGPGLVSAKEIIAAVDSAEKRVAQSPDTFALYSGLMADITMMLFEQARSALGRSQGLIREALECAGRPPAECDDLVQKLEGPLVHESLSHAATIGPAQAAELGLPVKLVDPATDEAWQIAWELWTRYFALGAWPAGRTAVYESRFASQIQG